MVDRVTEVLKVDESTIEPAPEIVVAGLESQYIRGVCDIGENKLLIMLDFSRVLLVDEIKRLKEVNAGRPASIQADMIRTQAAVGEMETYGQTYFDRR